MRKVALRQRGVEDVRYVWCKCGHRLLQKPGRQRVRRTLLAWGRFDVNLCLPLINRPIRFTQTTSTIIDNIISNAYDVTSTAGLLHLIYLIFALFYIASDVVIDVDVAKDLSRYSRMMNAERLTELSVNLDCIEWDLDTDSDDGDTCYGQI